MFPCLCAQGSSIAEYLDFSRIAVKETLACLCACTPCEGSHAQVTSQGEGGGGRGEGGGGGGARHKKTGSTLPAPGSNRPKLGGRLAQRSPHPPLKMVPGTPPPLCRRGLVRAFVVLKEGKREVNVSEDPSNTPPGSADFKSSSLHDGIPEQKVFLSFGGAILPKVQDKRSTNRSLQRPRALGFSAQNISEDYVCLRVPDSTRILKLTSKPRGYCPCHEQSSSSTLTVSPVSCWGFCRYCRIRTTTAIRMITTTMDLPFCSSLFLLRVLRPALPFSLDVFYSH